MSDLEFLYVLLAAFYLWECACWIPQGAAVFVGWWGRHCRPASLIGNTQGGFVLAQPLPPLGRLFVAAQLPVSVSPAGLLAYVATAVQPGGRPPQSGQFLRWEEVKSVQARRKALRINRARFAQAASTIHARWLADELRRLAGLSEADRPAAITRFLQSAFDRPRVQQRLLELDRRDRGVHRLANALLAALFLLAPAAVWQFGIVSAWPYLLSGVFALGAAVSILFLRAHRALHPAAGDERFAQFLMILLFPPAAVRARDMLSRPLLECYHPLTVATAVCRRESLEGLSRRLLRDLKHPAMPLQVAHDPQLAEVESWSRRVTLESAREMLRESGLNPDDLIRPPQPLDASCRAYCPRCHAQFTKVDAVCPDCGGIPVTEFDRERNSTPAA